MANASARFARQLCEARQRWFRQLSSEATKQRFVDFLQTRFNMFLHICSQIFRSYFIQHIVVGSYVFAVDILASYILAAVQHLAAFKHLAFQI